MPDRSWKVPTTTLTFKYQAFALRICHYPAEWVTVHPVLSTLGAFGASISIGARSHTVSVAGLQCPVPPKGENNMAYPKAPIISHIIRLSRAQHPQINTLQSGLSNA